MSFNVSCEAPSWCDAGDSGLGIEEIFAKGQLIVRGMPASNFLFTDDLGRQKISFKSWDHELDLMNSQAGIKALSASLILKDGYVDTYTQIGLLFDAAKVEISHVFKGDAGSSVTPSGAVEADMSLLCKDIEELKLHIEEKNEDVVVQSYNELKINAKLKSVTGIFFSICDKTAPGYFFNKLEALVWKKHIFEKYGLLLPVFEYARKGVLTQVVTEKAALDKHLPRFLKISALSQQYKFLRDFVFS